MIITGIELDMKIPDLTVCISVHNTSHLLPRCLDSVVCQTISNLEIILVNNGSTDDSEDIMYSYKEKYQNRLIKIVSQEDKGLAQGRQTGINQATGKYITFLDADDYLLSDDAYQTIYETAINFNVDIVSIDTYRGEDLIQDPFDGLHRTRDVLIRYFLEKDVNPMMWLRIYRRSLFETPVLPEIYINNEDVFAFPCILYKATTIFFLHKPFHHYSIDNTMSYMYMMKNNEELSTKNYERKLKSYLCIPFFKEYTGDGYKQDYKLYRAFADYECNSIIFSVLTECRNKNFFSKLKDIQSLLGFSSSSDMDLFLLQNIIPNTQIKKTVKKYGLFITYILIKIKKIFHR